MRGLTSDRLAPAPRAATLKQRLLMFLRRPAARVMFVCTENICRSPMAEALLRHRLGAAGLGKRLAVSSAGTRVSMPGHPPDVRAQRALADIAGVKMSGIRSKPLLPEDFQRCDYLLGMDATHRRYMLDVCPPEHRGKVELLAQYAADESIEEIPDPYFQSIASFNRVAEIIDRAVLGLLERLRLEHGRG